MSRSSDALVPALYRVISGGQTGVDRAALHAATHIGLPTGGFVPPERTDERGTVLDGAELEPLRAVDVLELFDADVRTFYPHAEPEQMARLRGRLSRTWRNAMLADGNLVLDRRPEGKQSGGTLALYLAAAGRPRLVVDPGDAQQARAVAEWIAVQRIRVLHVGGPAASEDPAIYADALGFLLDVFQRLGYPTLVHRMAADLRRGLAVWGDRSIAEGTLASALDGMYGARSEFTSSAQQLVNFAVLALTGGGAVLMVALSRGEPSSTTVRTVGTGLFLVAAACPLLLRHKLRAGYDLYVAACLHATVMFTAVGLPPSHHWMDIALRNALLRRNFVSNGIYSRVTRGRKARAAPARDAFDYCAVWRDDRAGIYRSYRRAIAFVVGIALAGIAVLWQEPASRALVELERWLGELLRSLR